MCSVLAAASIERAWAADWPGTAPVLRGSVSPGYVRWDGWQAGIQAGFGNMNADFGNSTSSLVAFILRNSTLEAEGAPSTWTALPSNTTSGAVFGGFVGYNWQWSELVVGWDLAYKRPASLNSTAGDSLRRLFDTSDSVRHDVTIDAQTSFKLVDYATLRGRAGYAFGEFLPYAVLGAAVGRFNYQTNVTVTDVMTDLTVAPPVPGDLGTFQQSASSGQKNVFVAGLTTGLGIDWAITPGVFLRAEWEYALFAPVNGTRSNINVGFVGLGARF
jgi:outer membrane immunogenic protein